MHPLTQGSAAGLLLRAVHQWWRVWVGNWGVILIFVQPGLFNSFCLEQGFDKVCETSRTLKLFEAFDVQFWETGPWAPPPTCKFSQLVVYVYYINNFRGKKGAGMGPCHHCRPEKGEPRGASAVLNKTLVAQKCATKFSFKETPWPDTDHKSCFI